MYMITPAAARALADDAGEAIRVLNHATHPADFVRACSTPAGAYRLLGALYELACRLPQLFAQISAFLVCQLQDDVITIDTGEYAGDPIGGIGTASHALEHCATQAPSRLASSLAGAEAQQAIAFAASRPVR